MDENIDEMRLAIVREAKEWLGTPWHHEARVKGSGVDCGMFILEIGERVGAIPHVDPPHYSMDFMLHNEKEWYLETVLQYCVELEGPPYLPGDIILFRHGRTYSHGAIVIDYPKIIHASFPDRCVCWEDVSILPWQAKKKKFLRYKGAV